MNDSEKEKLIEVTRGLIERDTSNPPGNENIVADYITEYLEASTVDFEFERYDIEPERPNLIARAGDDTKGTVLLTGHMDVVPANPDIWSGDPFELRREGDRLVGRGISDMKGSLAAKIIAAEGFLRETRDPGEVLLAFVMDEERGGLGTEVLADRGIEADGAIIGEPTDLDVAIAEYGPIGHTLTVWGQSGHSGRPDKAINAIDKMRRILDQVEFLENRLKLHSHPLLEPGPSINIGQIEGGSAPNVVPEKATAELFWRTIPGDDRDPEDYDAALRDAFQRARFDGEPIDVEIDQWHYRSGNQTPEDDPFVQDVMNGLRDANHDGELVGFNAGSDAYFLRKIDIPTVLLGPGTIEADAHTVDESIREDDLVTTVDIYRKILERTLG